MLVKHSINLNQSVDKNALFVLNQLIKHQYQAYLVGGFVRDLLLNKKPKDLDIVTNATPEQIHAIFKRSRIIGRRFRLVHVLFGRYDYLEVSTFRSGLITSSEKNNKLNNKIYGTIENDAERRDFTINALYYDIKTQVVLDYVGGLEDIKAKKLIMIGNESTRYVEDPVRLLRAIRFSAKFNLPISTAQKKNIIKHAPLLKDIASARLYEEVLKLFYNANSLKILHSLVEHQLFVYLFPNSSINPFIELALTNTQERIKKNLPLSPSFLMAVLLWEAFYKACQKSTKKQKLNSEIQYNIAQEIIISQIQHTSFAKYIGQQITEIWLLQSKLISKNKKYIKKTLVHKRFRAAYDFLVLNSKTEQPELKPYAKFWTKIQQEIQSN